MNTLSNETSFEKHVSKLQLGRIISTAKYMIIEGRTKDKVLEDLRQVYNLTILELRIISELV